MTGKTEISKEWSKFTGIPRFKASSEHTTYLGSKDRFVQQLRYADTRMVDFLGQTGHSVIFDRAWPCEYAYSKVFNRDTDLRALREVDSAYAALETWIIITGRTSYESIIDDIDPGITEETLKKIHCAYTEFMTWTKCRVLYLPVDDEDLEREIKDIMIGTGLCA